MKLIKFLFSTLAVLILATACTDDDALVFMIDESDASNSVVFTNVLASEYLLSQETASNIAERFVWEAVDFGVPSPVSYDLQASIDEAAWETVGTTTSNNLAVTVGQLLGLAGELGLEPDTPGTLFFRVRSYLGSGAGEQETFSEVQGINVRILVIESGGSGIEIASLGVVGSAANDWGGAGPDLPFYTTSSPGVLVAYVNLKDGEIKFRENNDWGTNYGDTGADGTLDLDGDNIAVTAGDYRITVDTNDLSYTIEPWSIGVVGSAWNDWGAAGPDKKFFYDYTSDTFVVGVKLLDGEMKIRQNNDWGTNWGDTGADGTIELDGDNIAVTAGFYQIRVDLNNLTIAVEEASLLGVVGSGFNDWGGAGPDFTFTQINPDYWKAENVTLIDGEIKFRINEDWGTNYGDTGADGTLELDGDNIAVTAGVYDIFVDFRAGANTYTLITK